MKSKIKEIRKYLTEDLYKINFKNIIFIIVFVIVFTAIFELCKNVFKCYSNIHLGLSFNVDFFAIYSCIISLMIPLAILIVEKFSKNKDYILSETYLKETYMFPTIIYYCTTLVIFIILNDQYYFVLSIVLSIIILIYMYYHALKLLSDIVYEKRKLNNVYANLIEADLKVHLQNYDTDNKITGYTKYGIFVEGINFTGAFDYKRSSIRSLQNYELIEKYNYKYINDILSILKKENESYIKQPELLSENSIEKELKPNIMIVLLRLGDTLKLNGAYANIYYTNVSDEKIKALIEKLEKNIYITNKLNYFSYVENNGVVILNKCVSAINNGSSAEFENGLKDYRLVYENFIPLIRKYIGDYSYEVAYQQTHSFYEPKAYGILKWIRNDIYEYSHIIEKKDDFKIMNELTGFLYGLVLFSYNNLELFSIQYIYSTYEYLNYNALKLTENHTCMKIKLELFEFINFVLYDLDDNRNIEFCKNVLLICNKTIINITETLFNENLDLFEIYILNIKKFIKSLNQKISRLKHGDNDVTINLKNLLITVLEHYESNIFAMNAYLLKKLERENRNIDIIIRYYNNYNAETLSKIYLKTNSLDFNDSSYNWDVWEDHDLDRNDGMWNVNTSNYLAHLYCVCLNKISISKIKLPIDSNLSDLFDGTLIKELDSLNNDELITKFKEMKAKVIEEEKEYLRKTNISFKKVEKFIENFQKHYEENAELYKVMKKYNNFEIIDQKSNGKNYLEISNILEKTYFLDKMPNNRNIYFLDFENNFAESFIRSEAKKYAEKLFEKSKLEKLKLSEFIIEKFSSCLDDIVILANYKFEYQILDLDKIKYGLKADENSIDASTNIYFEINGINIPVYNIDGLGDYYYVINKNRMGKMQKLEMGFEFDVAEFTGNDKLLEKLMNEKIKGSNLTGDDKKNYLLESVRVSIKEYVTFDLEDLESYKFMYIISKD